MDKGSSIIEVFFVVLIISLSFNFSRIQFKPNFCKRLVNFLDNAQILSISLQKEINVEVLKNEIRVLDFNRKIKIPKYAPLKNISFGNLIYGKNIITYRSNGTASAGRVGFGQDLKQCNLIQSIYGAKRIE